MENPSCYVNIVGSEPVGCKLCTACKSSTLCALRIKNVENFWGLHRCRMPTDRRNDQDSKVSFPKTASKTRRKTVASSAEAVKSRPILYQRHSIHVVRSPVVSWMNRKNGRRSTLSVTRGYPWVAVLSFERRR